MYNVLKISSGFRKLKIIHAFAPANAQFFEIISIYAILKDEWYYYMIIKLIFIKSKVLMFYRGGCSVAWRKESETFFSRKPSLAVRGRPTGVQRDSSKNLVFGSLRNPIYLYNNTIFLFL